MIDKINDKPASWEETVTIREKDKYKVILGDAGARVSASLGERMGGSRGFSSVSMNATVTLNCNQDSKTIPKAYSMAFAEAKAAIVEFFPEAMELLEEHLDQHHAE